MTYGSGLLNRLIRAAELDMTRSPKYPRGDTQASWAGHCVVYIGEHTFPGGKTLPAIVEAEWPRVRIAPASAHTDTIWASGQPLTEAQRLKGVDEALRLVGVHYDVAVYAWYVAKVLGLAITRDLAPLLTDTRFGQVICSGVMVLTQMAMSVDLSGLSTAAIKNPDFTSPADCFRWGISHGWMDWVPPAAAASFWPRMD